MSNHDNQHSWTSCRLCICLSPLQSLLEECNCNIALAASHRWQRSHGPDALIGAAESLHHHFQNCHVCLSGEEGLMLQKFSHYAAN